MASPQDWGAIPLDDSAERARPIFVRLSDPVAPPRGAKLLSDADVGLAPPKGATPTGRTLGDYRGPWEDNQKSDEPKGATRVTGPEVWGAQPLTDWDVGIRPLTDEYIKGMAQRHGVNESTVRWAAREQYPGQAAVGAAGTFGLGSLVPKAGAAITAAAAPYTGADVHGTFGEGYNKERALRQELATDFERDYPVLSKGLEIGGSLTSVMEP
jgi:hypothetical protein